MKFAEIEFILQIFRKNHEIVSVKFLFRSYLKFSFNFSNYVFEKVFRHFHSLNDEKIRLVTGGESNRK